jgi:hypothetical protein
MSPADQQAARRLGDEMIDLLERIGAASVDVGREVAGRIDRHRDEPDVAHGIGALSEVFEMPNP